MLQAENAEKGEQVLGFVVQEQILATQVEKLLKTQEYQNYRHDSLACEQGESEPEAKAASNGPKNVFSVLFCLQFIFNLKILTSPHPSSTVGIFLYLFRVLINYAFCILISHLNHSVLIYSTLNFLIYLSLQVQITRWHLIRQNFEEYY